MKRTLLLLAVLTAGLRPGRADAAAPITLAPMFRDHAVLQRGVPLPIWGTAEPGATVAVRLVRAGEADAEPGGKTEAAAGDGVYAMNCKNTPPDPPILADRRRHFAWFRVRLVRTDESDRDLCPRLRGAPDRERHVALEDGVVAEHRSEGDRRGRAGGRGRKRGNDERRCAAQ